MQDQKTHHVPEDAFESLFPGSFHSTADTTSGFRLRASASILMILTILFLSGCGATSVTRSGSGSPAEDRRDLEPFSRVEVSGSFYVEIRRDSLHHAIVVIDDNLTGHILTEVTEGILRIRPEGRFRNLVQARVIVGAPYIPEIFAEGTHQLRALEVDSDVLRLTVRGTMHMELAGLVDDLNLDLDGTCVVNAGDLEALYVSMKSRGITTSTVNAVRSIRVEGTGSTRVWYLGEPGSVESEIEGRGFVVKEEERGRQPEGDDP
jgi:hypothetical protein